VATGIGLGLGAAGTAAPFTAEWWKKPRLRVVRTQWLPRGPIPPMTFASALVINAQLGWPMRKFLDRNPALACEVSIDFFRWGEEVPLFDTVTGRWDNTPQPVRISELTAQPPAPQSPFPAIGPGYISTTPAPESGLPVGASFPGTIPTSFLPSLIPAAGVVSWQYDPGQIVSRQDIPPGDSQAQISVAILRNGQAFAFGNESYRYGPPNHLCNPAWKLERKTVYRVEVRVKGLNVDHREVFKLPVYSADFTKFQLTPA
jgi:hypothetical protein